MRANDAYKGGAKIVRQWRKKSSGVRIPWQLRWQPVCSSTELVLSKWLLDQPWQGSHPRAVLAERQRHGIGQHGRVWHSPKGGVWISAAMPWCHGKNSPELLGLTVAVAMAEKLESRGLSVQIKWPNDLLVRGRKLVGILPKLVHRGSQLRLARVGIGLNVSNRVPLEGIALKELFLPRQSQSLEWATEVLLVLDRAMDLASRPGWICSESEKRLWETTIFNPDDGFLWDVDGIETHGGIKLRRDGKNIIWTRWS